MKFFFYQWWINGRLAPENKREQGLNLRACRLMPIQKNGLCLLTFGGIAGPKAKNSQLNMRLQFEVALHLKNITERIFNR